MRLSNHDREHILDIILSRDAGAKVYLYGSRVDDSLKGGDIDLWICSDHLKFSDKIEIIDEIKCRIGDQKIDLSIKPSQASEADPFFRSLTKIRL